MIIRGDYPKGVNNIEVMRNMTAKEILNLIDWLRAQGFNNDKIIDCIEAVEGKEKAAVHESEESSH